MCVPHWRCCCCCSPSTTNKSHGRKLWAHCLFDKRAETLAAKGIIKKNNNAGNNKRIDAGATVHVGIKAKLFQRRLTDWGSRGWNPKMPPHMLAGSMCSHRRRILCWDSSRPGVTMITPTRWLWQSWPLVWLTDLLTAWVTSHAKVYDTKAANLGNASLFERRPRRRYMPPINTRRGRCINNHQLIRYWARCRFRAGPAPAAAACSASPLAWVSCFSRRN